MSYSTLRSIQTLDLDQHNQDYRLADHNFSLKQCADNLTYSYVHLKGI